MSEATGEATSEATSEATKLVSDTAVDVMDTGVKYRPMGTPDGPMKFVPELGEETPTFTQKPSSPKLNPCLLHHVPLDKRGPFRPESLANYRGDQEYRTDGMGYLLCYATVTPADGPQRRCGRRALNRFPRCHQHGGRLHPLDKAERIDPKTVGADEFSGMTRYQQYKCGMISIHDLDDEEIANHGFRTRSGKFYQPPNMPREMLQAFAEQVYERATLAMRAGATDAAQTIVDIMKDPLIEPHIRLKAAETLLDRTLGKAPQTVRLEHQAPWEAIFEAIGGGSRADSRARRGVDSVRMQPEIVRGDAVGEIDCVAVELTAAEDNTEDAEVVEF